MAASDKVFIAALLLMTMLSISHRAGVSASGNVNLCPSGICAKLIEGTTDERLCKKALDCVNTLGCTKEEKEKTKKKLADKGCSGSGIPIISTMSLFVAALFHML